MSSWAHVNLYTVVVGGARWWLVVGFRTHRTRRAFSSGKSDDRDGLGPTTILSGSPNALPQFSLPLPLMYAVGLVREERSEVQLNSLSAVCS